MRSDAACVTACDLPYAGNNLFGSIVFGRLPEGLAGVILGLIFSLALAIPTILSNVALFYSVPRLAERYEMHHTHAGKEVPYRCNTPIDA